MASRQYTPWTPLATRRLASSSTPWTPFEQVEHHRTRTKPPDTLSTATRDRRRRRRRRNPAADAARQGNNATALGTAYPSCRRPEDRGDVVNTPAPSPSSIACRRSRAIVDRITAPPPSLNPINSEFPGSNGAHHRTHHPSLPLHHPTTHSIIAGAAPI
jgi:hypothetical protein